jgi:hypothetical protein
MPIADSEIVVVDAPAPRHQVESELQGVHVREPSRVLEIRLALARGFLEAFDARLALELVLRQGFGDILFDVQGVHERDRVLHRKLRPGADREVRCMGGVAHEDGLAMVPASSRKGRKTYPLRVVRHEVPAPQIVVE